LAPDATVLGVAPPDAQAVMSMDAKAIAERRDAGLEM